MRITLIVAVAENGVIGRDRQLPWHLPDDLKRFKALTMGKALLMGRRTFESIGRPLPGRRNLVLSRSVAVDEATVLAPGTSLEHVATIDEALRRCAGVEELCVIGGAEVFRVMLPRASDLRLTRVHAQVDGDVLWPPIDAREWRETGRVDHSADERHAWPMTFIDMVRC